MKKFIIETSTSFDEMVEEYGLEGISDLDITDELNRHEETIQEKGRIEACDYNDGMLEIFRED